MCFDNIAKNLHLFWNRDYWEFRFLCWNFEPRILEWLALAADFRVWSSLLIVSLLLVQFWLIWFVFCLSFKQFCEFASFFNFQLFIACSAAGLQVCGFSAPVTGVLCSALCWLVAFAFSAFYLGCQIVLPKKISSKSDNALPAAHILLVVRIALVVSPLVLFIAFAM